MWQNPKSPYYDGQVQVWQWFAQKMREQEPIDALICNGDMVDGGQTKCGARGLITADYKEQADMASEVVSAVRARNHFFVAGTPYHTGREGDWEALIAQRFGSELEGHLFASIGGVTFSCRHKVGASTVPYGRATQITKENIWNRLQTEGWQPHASIFVRSHVHYFIYAGDGHSLALTTPCLQIPGSIYGERNCSGTIDVGFVWFETNEGVLTNWGWELFTPTPQTAPEVRTVA